MKHNEENKMKSTTKAFIQTAAVFILGILLLAVALGLMSSVLLKGCEEINERGLKNIVEEVWEGKQKQGE